MLAGTATARPPELRLRYNLPRWYGTMSEDKRQSPRVDTNIEIMFKEKGSFIKSYMRNVSNGGIYIKTDAPLPIDGRVNLKMKLPDIEESMEIQGRVVWINPKSGNNSFPPGMGIQFVTIRTDHKDFIDRFVEKHQREIVENSII
jgi:type IV pilus assembly protein PilZ